MTAIPEAKLAREAEICYATIAMVTDFDCWKEAEETVSLEMILSTMRGNTSAVQKMLPDIVVALKDREDCPCRHAAANALMTDPSSIPHSVKRNLALFYAKYWENSKKR